MAWSGDAGLARRRPADHGFTIDGRCLYADARFAKCRARQVEVLAVPVDDLGKLRQRLDLVADNAPHRFGALARFFR